jgi:hypothetical protein
VCAVSTTGSAAAGDLIAGRRPSRVFRFELAPGHIVRPAPAMSLAFERGLRVVAQAR